MTLSEREFFLLRGAKRLKAYRINKDNNKNTLTDIYNYVKYEVSLYDNNDKNNQLTKSSASSAKVWLLRCERLLVQIKN